MQRTGVARVVFVDVGTGVPLATGVLTWLVATALAVSANVTQFSPGAADPLNYVLTSTAFIGPLSAGAGALHAAAVVRSGVAGLAETTVRGQASTFRVAALSVAFWQVFAVVTAAVVVLLRADVAGGANTASMLMLPLLAVVLVLVCVLLGVAIGSRWTSLVVPPAVTVAVFAWIYGCSFATGKPQRLSPVYPDVFYRVWFEPHTILVASQAGVLAAVAVLLAARVVASRRAMTVVVGVVLLVAAGSLWAATDASSVQYRQAPAHSPCRQIDSVSLCYWPQSANQVGASLRALALVHTRLRGLTQTPTRFAETGLSDRLPDRRPFELPTPWERDYLFRAILAAEPTVKCHTQAGLDASYELDSFYRAVVSDQPAPVARLRRLQRGPERVARAWVAAQVKVLRTCR